MSSSGSLQSQWSPWMGLPTATDNTIHLWEFLYKLLNTNEHPQLLSWTSSNGEFTIHDGEGVAKLWGERKAKPHMDNDKLSRALRYYDQKNIIKKVYGQKEVYCFVGFPDHVGQLSTTNTPPSNTWPVWEAFKDKEFPLMSDYPKAKNPGETTQGEEEDDETVSDEEDVTDSDEEECDEESDDDIGDFEYCDQVGGYIPSDSRRPVDDEDATDSDEVECSCVDYKSDDDIPDLVECYQDDVDEAQSECRRPVERHSIFELQEEEKRLAGQATNPLSQPTDQFATPRQVAPPQYQPTNQVVHSNYQHTSQVTYTQQQPANIANPTVYLQYHPGYAASYPTHPGNATTQPQHHPGYAAARPQIHPGYSGTHPQYHPGNAAAHPQSHPGYAATHPQQYPGYAATRPQHPYYSGTYPQYHPGYAAARPQYHPAYSVPDPQSHPGYPTPPPQLPPHPFYQNNSQVSRAQAQHLAQLQAYRNQQAQMFQAQAYQAQCRPHVSAYQPPSQAPHPQNQYANPTNHVAQSHYQSSYPTAQSAQPQYPANPTNQAPQYQPSTHVVQPQYLYNQSSHVYTNQVSQPQYQPANPINEAAPPQYQPSTHVAQPQYHQPTAQVAHPQCSPVHPPNQVVSVDCWPIGADEYDERARASHLLKRFIDDDHKEPDAESSYVAVRYNGPPMKRMPELDDDTADEDSVAMDVQYIDSEDSVDYIDSEDEYDIMDDETIDEEFKKMNVGDDKA